MAQNFLGCDRGQAFLLPPSLDEWLPADHFARFVIAAVEAMDLTAFYRPRPGSPRHTRRAPPFRNGLPGDGAAGDAAGTQLRVATIRRPARGTPRVAWG